MALSIKTAEADRLARDLAARTHESITDAITVALRERLARVEAEDASQRTKFHRDIRDLVARARAADDPRPAESIEWDEHGLPL